MIARTADLWKQRAAEWVRERTWRDLRDVISDEDSGVRVARWVDGRMRALWAVQVGAAGVEAVLSVALALVLFAWFNPAQRVAGWVVLFVMSIVVVNRAVAWARSMAVSVWFGRTAG